MASYQITISEEQLYGLFEGDHTVASLFEAVLNQVLHGQATEQLKIESSPTRELRNGQDVGRGSENDPW